MAASESVSPVELLREQIEGASPDVWPRTRTAPAGWRSCGR